VARRFILVALSRRLRAALLEGLVSLEIAMRPDVEAMKADIEQSVALLRRRL
jgi:hypothetical protein